MKWIIAVPLIFMIACAIGGCQGEQAGQALDIITDPNNIQAVGQLAGAITPFIPAAGIVAIVLVGLAGIIRRIN